MKKAHWFGLSRGRTGGLAQASLTLLMLALAKASTAEQSGDFKYEIVNDGTAVMISLYTGTGGELTIPSRIEGLPVIAIGNSAFFGRDDLTGPLILPDSVTTIGAGAFYECANLTSLTLGGGVTEIGVNAFAFCRSLSGPLTLPEGLTTVNGYAFCQCNALTGELRIPDSVTSIGQSAFVDCRNFTSLRLGDGLRLIGNSAFLGCSGLSDELVIPDNVAHIAGYAFSHCDALTSLNLGTGVTNIEFFAFAYCYNLTGTLAIPDSVESIGSAAFFLCTHLTGLTFGNGLKNLAEFAFADCANLTGEVVLPEGVTMIERRTFYLCFNLTGITLGDGVTSIGESAFFSCSKLSGAVVIPEGVALIGDFTFDSCQSIGGLYFKGDAPSVGIDALHNVTCAVFYVSGRSGWGATFGGRPADVWTSTATFDAMPGSVTPGALAYLVGQPYQTLPTPVHEHLVFNGWWTGPNGTGEQAESDSVVPYLTAGHTLYAQWLQQTNEVTFHAQAGVEPYPASKTVVFGEAYGALPPTARLGYAFGGWWTAPGGQGARVAEATRVTETQNHVLYASWAYQPNAAQHVQAGTALEMPLPDTFDAAGRVTVKSLPAGLKYQAATRTVWGVPTKAGSFPVTLAAAGVEPLNFTFTVEALPAWAQGLFGGYTRGGMASMSVSSQGRATLGKLTYLGTSTTFSAASYLSGGNPATGFALSTVATAGKLRVPLEIIVTQAPSPSPQSLGQAAAKSGADTLALMWRGIWKDEPAALAPYIGYYTATLPGGDAYGSGYLTFTVDKAGKVKVAGKLADGAAASASGTLILDEAGRVFAVVYAAPAAYKGGRLFGLAEFVVPAEGEVYLRPLDGEPFEWQSRNPQATGVIGAGFSRETGLSGGWYSKTANLAAYYAGKELTAGVDPDAAAPALAVGAVRYDAIWWAPTGIALTPTLKSGVMAGLAAPAAGKPVDPDKDGVWDYGAANAVGLKVSLTRATGVFKGSFLAWFDYPVKKHVSKSLAFEGALTPVRANPDDGVEGRGYFLWPDKAVPPLPAKPYAFKWSYDFLLRAE